MRRVKKITFVCEHAIKFEQVSVEVVYADRYVIVNPSRWVSEPLKKEEGDQPLLELTPEMWHEMDGLKLMDMFNGNLNKGDQIIINSYFAQEHPIQVIIDIELNDRLSDVFIDDLVERSKKEQEVKDEYLIQ